jgi:hypothetical protein
LHKKKYYNWEHKKSLEFVSNLSVICLNLEHIQ